MLRAIRYVRAELWIGEFWTPIFLAFMICSVVFVTALLSFILFVALWPLGALLVAGFVGVVLIIRALFALADRVDEESKT